RSYGMQHGYGYCKYTWIYFMDQMCAHNTFILPVTTSLINAVRYSVNKSISFSVLAFLASMRADSLSIKSTITCCSSIDGNKHFKWCSLLALMPIAVEPVLYEYKSCLKQSELIKYIK